MHQFEFTATHKTSGRTAEVRATATTEAIARAQCQLAWREYAISALVAIRDPHAVLGEIDASDFPHTDTAWLMNKAASL